VSHPEKEFSMKPIKLIASIALGAALVAASAPGQAQEI